MEGAVYAEFSSALFVFTVIEVCLMIILYTTRNLYFVAFIFSAFVDFATVSLCLQYGMVTEYLMELIFIPIFLFYFFGARVGLAAMSFLCAQAVALLWWTTYISTPNQELSFSPTDRLLVRTLIDLSSAAYMCTRLAVSHVTHNVKQFR